jgi:hypothetical protein
MLKSLILFAVASHHTPLHQNLYSSVVKDEYDPIQILNVKDKKHFAEIAFELAKKICIMNNEQQQYAAASLYVTDKCYSTSCFKLLQEAK